MYKGINITFTNVKTVEGREGLAVRCFIKHNGKKIAEYYDDAGGGEIRIDAVGSIDKQPDGSYKKSAALIKNRALLKALQEEFAALPKLKYEYKGMDGPSYLDECIDYAVDEFINEREQRKQDLRLAKKGLIFENAEGEGYSISFKAGAIPTLLKKYKKEQVLDLVNKKIIKYQEEGNTIKCQDYYVSIGINPEIFTK